MKKSVLLTGSSGFIGKNLVHFFDDSYKTICYNREQNERKIEADYVIHLAGIAHDTRNSFKENDYYTANTELTKIVFDNFLKSNAEVFIFFSSVKAVADEFTGELTETTLPKPKTHYGKSKLLAEQYIHSISMPQHKRVYIIRPCMIHGKDNKGNLRLLYQFVKRGIIWPLGSYDNARSYCSIDNLCFIVKELLENDQIESGIYNIADDMPISTNQLINLIAECQNKKITILNIPKFIITTIVKVFDIFNFGLTTEKLYKLTNSYIVCNSKIKNAIGKPLPLNSLEGLKKTFSNF